MKPETLRGARVLKGRLAADFYAVSRRRVKRWQQTKDAAAAGIRNCNADMKTEKLHFRWAEK